MSVVLLTWISEVNVNDKENNVTFQYYFKLDAGRL